MQPLQSAGIFSTPTSIDQAFLVKMLIDSLCKNQFGISIHSETDHLMKELGFDLQYPTFNILFDHIDFIVSLGGDGTVLKTSHIIGNNETPIIGINTGRLGFLADIKKEDLDSILLSIKAGQYNIEERTLIQYETSCYAENKYALNEISVQKQGRASLLTIHSYIDDVFLSSFWADGIVIATPTGSTAYSLSLGGPIISPQTDALIMNPIAPHTLTVRPIILPGNSNIKLIITGRNLDYIISNDSEQIASQKELEINVYKAGHSIKFMKFHGYNYYSTLREKLMWGADIRN